MNEDIQRDYIKILESRIKKLEEKISLLDFRFSFLGNIKEMKSGAGDTSMSFDRNGLWLGKNKWADIISTPPGGTGIGTDGSFYPKNGVSGTLTPGTGSITSVRGIITAIS